MFFHVILQDLVQCLMFVPVMIPGLSTAFDVVSRHVAGLGTKFNVQCCA